jgi:hypothetical protein
MAAGAEVQPVERNPAPFHLGAMLGAVSLPRPVDAEVFVRLGELLSVGASYSDFPAFIANPLLSAVGAKNSFRDARLDDFSAFELDLRLMPWQGSFFAGASFGRQTLKGAVIEHVVCVSGPCPPQTANVDLTTFYATPRAGWLWTMGPGLLLGFDVGVQLKLASSANVTLPPGATTSVRNAAQSLADLGASYPLPSFHLRLGWML